MQAAVQVDAREENARVESTAVEHHRPIEDGRDAGTRNDAHGKRLSHLRQVSGTVPNKFHLNVLAHKILTEANTRVNNIFIFCLNIFIYL